MTRINAPQPIDANNKVIPLGALEGTAYAKTYDSTLSSASDIVLNASTTSIIVTAITKGVFMRYAATASSTDFDEFIPADTTVVFARPAGVTTISIIEQTTSAAVVVIEK